MKPPTFPSLSAETIAGIFFSLFLHLLFFLALFNDKHTNKTETIVTNAELIIEPPAKQLAKPHQQENQIVSSEISNTKEEIALTKLLAEKNNSVEKEQIKKGDSSRSPEKSIMKPAQNQKSQSIPQQAKIIEQKTTTTQKKITTLKLDQSTLNEKFSNSSDKESSNDKKLAPITSLQPFSRPSGSGAQFFGSFGSNDYLPNLPDGDITLLNTKADQFAVFVRRVATRVFAQLRSSGWENLSASDIDSLNNFSVVSAELTLTGELIKIQLQNGSGSQRFDSVVTTSVKNGARDPHPPKEAASTNGNIKFIFKSKSWVQGAINPRTGAPVERRWLLLGVGLE